MVLLSRKPEGAGWVVGRGRMSQHRWVVARSENRRVVYSEDRTEWGIDCGCGNSLAGVVVIVQCAPG